VNGDRFEHLRLNNMNTSRIISSQLKKASYILSVLVESLRFSSLMLSMLQVTIQCTCINIIIISELKSFEIASVGRHGVCADLKIVFRHKSTLIGSYGIHS